VRFETGRKPGANRGERDENLGQDAATDYYDSELDDSDEDVDLPSPAPRLTRKRVTPSSFPAKATAALAPASYAINEDIDITDANKVAKAWKSSVFLVGYHYSIVPVC
ncbi:hypothetical protein FOL46_004912, partial [Perkinsus olseni]